MMEQMQRPRLRRRNRSWRETGRGSRLCRLLVQGDVQTHTHAVVLCTDGYVMYVCNVCGGSGGGDFCYMEYVELWNVVCCTVTGQPTWMTMRR